MAEAAELVSIAAQNIPGVDGRPLYAGWASLDWPTEPHLRFWHALTLLREYRGDGHIAALQTAGLNGLDALITHTRDGNRVSAQVRADSPRMVAGTVGRGRREFEGPRTAGSFVQRADRGRAGLA